MVFACVKDYCCRFHCTVHMGGYLPVHCKFMVLLFLLATSYGGRGVYNQQYNIL